MSLRSDAAEIVFDHVTKRYAGRSGRRSTTCRSRSRPGEICVLDRPVGRRQDDRDEDGQPADLLRPRATSRSTARASTTLDPVELRRGIGYVIQQIGLFPHMTIEANVATVPRLLGWDKQRTRDARRASCSSSSASTPTSTASAIRRSCPAASASASGWRGRWRRTRR